MVYTTHSSSLPKLKILNATESKKILMFIFLFVQMYKNKRLFPMFIFIKKQDILIFLAKATNSFFARPLLILKNIVTLAVKFSIP